LQSGRYHTFLLDTAGYGSVSIRASRSIATTSLDRARELDPLPLDHARRCMTDHPSGFTIAVVDDDPEFSSRSRWLLESADHAVRVFASPQQCSKAGVSRRSIA
jgi:hypothetical protein